MRKPAVEPPPDVHSRSMRSAEMAVALSPEACGGGGMLLVVAVAATPGDGAGVALALMAQIRKVYCVEALSPDTTCAVPLMLPSPIWVPSLQLKGATAPAW